MLQLVNDSLEFCQPEPNNYLTDKQCRTHVATWPTHSRRWGIDIRFCSLPECIPDELVIPARWLCVQMKRIDESIKCYQQALRLQPAYHVALNNLGNVLKSTGRLDEAVAQ